MDFGQKTPIGSPSDQYECRAREIGFGDLHYTECLSQNHASCEHSLPFGNVVICRHPQHLIISARTAAPGEIIQC